MDVRIYEHEFILTEIVHYAKKVANLFWKVHNGLMAKKVLIVDDDESFLWILKQSFSKGGVSVVFAQDGEEGLKLAQEEKPDLILLDIMMPKMDGIAVAKRLKELGIETQIIFLTNVADNTKITEAVASVDRAGYIIKSDMHVDQIVSVVREKLGLK